MTTARLAVAVSALVTISSQVLRKLVFNVRIGLTREGLIFPVTGAVCNLVLCGKNLASELMAMVNRSARFRGNQRERDHKEQ